MKDNPESSRSELAKKFKISTVTVSRFRKEIAGEQKKAQEPIQPQNSTEAQPAETWAVRYARLKHERLTGTGAYAPK